MRLDLDAIRAYRWPIGMGFLALAGVSAFVLVREFGYLPSATAAGRPDQATLQALEQLQQDKNALQAKVSALEASTTGVPTAAAASAGAEATSLVNINTAGESQLETLPGIGPSKAKAIIDYRTSHGPFTSPKSITNVKGIGKSTYEKLAPLITVGP